MNKSFRGKLADGDTITIRLSTNNGLVGYRIHKFQLFATDPGTSGFELVSQIYTQKPATATNVVNFDDPTLLAAAYYGDSSAVGATEANQTVVFDNTVFNQDIFLTMVDANTTVPGNYYLELEQIKLDLGEATVATLKDMRGRE